MYYVKNISLVFMLIGLSYCQTGKEQEEELTAKMMRAGAGAAAEPTVRLQSSDGHMFVVPLRIARKSQTIANLLDDLGVVAAPITLPLVTQEGLALILRLLRYEAITQARLGADLRDLQVPANKTRALQLLNASDYLDIEDLLQQTAIYLGNSFTVAEINSWREIPRELVDMIIRLKIGVKAVSAGEFHTCAIRTNDTVQCWGFNDHEQSDEPPDLGNVKAVSVGGGFHTCAIKTNDTVQCWGLNNFRQSDVPPDLGYVKAVSAGRFHTCAIRTNDTVQCWGDNVRGQRDVPPNLGNVKAVSAGEANNCAIKTNDTVQCWGYNGYGQSDVPPDLGYVKAVSAGRFHTCAIKTNDTVQCWGSNDRGQITVPANLRP